MVKTPELTEKEEISFRVSLRNNDTGKYYRKNYGICGAFFELWHDKSYGKFEVDFFETINDKNERIPCLDIHAVDVMGNKRKIYKGNLFEVPSSPIVNQVLQENIVNTNEEYVQGIEANELEELVPGRPAHVLGDILVRHLGQMQPADIVDTPEEPDGVVLNRLEAGLEPFGEEIPEEPEEDIDDPFDLENAVEQQDENTLERELNADYNRITYRVPERRNE